MTISIVMQNGKWWLKTTTDLKLSMKEVQMCLYAFHPHKDPT